NEQYLSAKTNYLALKRSTFRQSLSHEWDSVISQFRALLDSKPPSHIAEVASFTLGQVYYDRARSLKDPRSLTGALHYFHQVATLFSRGPLADNAQVLEGDIYFYELKDYPRAYQAYRYVVKYFPRGDMAGTAQLRLRDLHKLYAPPAQASPSPSGTQGRRTAGRVRPGAAVVTNVRHWSNRAYTRVVVDLTGPATYTKRRIGSPDRIYVDLQPARLSPTLTKKTLTVNDGLLKRVRFAQNRPGVVRVVVDIDSLHDFKIFTRTNPHRLTIDIHGNRIATTAPLKDIPIWGEGPPAKGPQPIRTVVLDPGHGGKDPGAVGRRGLTEKEVNLDIAKRLARLLQSTRVRVILTRDRDVFVALEERTAIANINNADLFISIHANASPHRGAKGVETYYLNATEDERILRFAAQENNIPVAEMTVLEKILLDLDATDNATRSIPLANAIQTTMVQSLKRRYRGVNNLGAKPGPFYVLVGAKMPAVLIETSFISNYKEERRLRDTSYRQRIAHAIFGGVQQYARHQGVALHARR
ncbi:MAG: N-acetylmuramoyl-L-alanine amidase, partial [Nitrospinota bacterium]